MVTTSGVLSLLLSLLFLTTVTISSFSSASDNDNNNIGKIKSFYQCFLNKYSSPQLLHTSSSSSYQPILLSSAQNLRFLISETNQKPAVILTATLESHVSESVVCARKHGLGIRVRSGGHDYEGMSYVSWQQRDKPFVLVDLASLRSIEVDVPRGTAWVQAGATLGELYYWANKESGGRFGFPAGTCPTVGVGGHVSGGGQGTMVRKFGLSADNVVDARVVGVDGRILDRTGMGEDLFWAIRGGGAASFGVVVAYQLRLVEVPPFVTVFNVVRSLDHNTSDLVTRWQEVAPYADKNLFLRVIALPEITDGGNNVNMKVMFNSFFLGNKTQLLHVMEKSFPELKLRAEDASEISWIESTLGDLPQGSGIEGLLNRTSYYLKCSFKAKSDYVNKPISREDWDKIWKFILRGGKEEIEPLAILLEPYGGRMSEIPGTETPFPHRTGNLYNIQYFMRWNGTDAAASQRHLDWITGLYSFMTPYVSSNPRAAYYNYKDIDIGYNRKINSSIDQDDDQEEEEEYRKSQVWGNKYFLDNFRRLASVKARVDPDNFFRNEQSIPPLL